MSKRLLLCTLIILLLAGCAPLPDEPQGAAAGEAVEATPADAQDTQESTAAVSAPAATDVPGAAGVSGTQQGFAFKAYGQEIYVCMEARPILDALPEPKDTFESPSCAFDGIDITYFYPGFELTTYPDNGKEYVLSVVFTDDSITTPEGVYLGGSLEDVQRVHGTGYTHNGNRYVYTNGQGELIFTLEDGVIRGIIYTMIIEG